MQRDLIVNAELTIPRDEFRWAFVRSSGPGGQHVNKVNSKAVLRWSVVDSPSLPEAVRGRLLAACRSQVTSAGELVLTSQRFREQHRNAEDCLQKLGRLVRAATVVPRPRKRRKVSAAAKERRLRSKRELAQKKQRRRERFDREE